MPGTRKSVGCIPMAASPRLGVQGEQTTRGCESSTRKLWEQKHRNPSLLLTRVPEKKGQGWASRLLHSSWGASASSLALKNENYRTWCSTVPRGWVASSAGCSMCIKSHRANSTQHLIAGNTVSSTKTSCSREELQNLGSASLFRYVIDLGHH